MIRLTVTVRIALLAVALALATNLLLAGVVWTRTHDDAIGAVRREAAEQRETLAAVWRAGGRRALAAAVDEAATADPALVVALLDGRGRGIAGSAPDGWRLPARATGFEVASSPAGAVGYLLAPVGRDWLVTGRLLASVEEGQRTVERALLVAVLLSVALGAGAGAVIARYVAARLDRIAAVAVTLRLARVADGVAIGVEDRGPGIAEADRAAALRRFGRLDAARSVPGAGLGTALVEAVARLHDGRLDLADNAPGLIARLVLPAPRV